VPLTGLDVYLPQTHPEYRLALPVSEHPFTALDRVPPPGRAIDAAIRAARGRSIYLVAPLPSDKLAGSTRQAAELRRQGGTLAPKLLRRAQPRFLVVDRRELPGLASLVVIVLRDRRAGGG
jgi:hypothetical protein